MNALTYKRLYGAAVSVCLQTLLKLDLLFSFGHTHVVCERKGMRETS